MKIKSWLPWVIIAILLFFLFGEMKREDKVIEVPFKVEVPVPVVEKQFDTIYEPKPVMVKEEVNSEYYEKYLALKDSIQKDSLVQELSKKRVYDEEFEDSIQTINVHAETTGYLDKLSVDYKTKPRSVKIDTVLQVKDKKDYNISVGVEAGIPTTGQGKAVVKPSIQYNSNKYIYSVGYDSEGRVWAGIKFKLF